LAYDSLLVITTSNTTQTLSVI